MANPRKPPALKVVAGTDRRDRDVQTLDLPPVKSAPDPPSWMPNPHAITEWNRLVPILMANNLLTDADLSALAQACALHGKCVQLYAAGEAPTASMVGTLRNLLNDFGLTPVARGKVKPTDAAPKQNAFSANKRGGKSA